jgi:trk system potassium uptake protein
VIGQLAREKYGVERVVSRVNDPRNQQLFDLLGLDLTVSATQMVLGLIEHEVPAHELIHLLELRKENLEIVEVEVDEGAPGVGRRVEQLSLPEGARLISVMRGGKAEIAVGSTRLEAGDQVLAILEPGRERELRRILLKT